VTDSIPNLWPDDIGAPKLRAPVVILREQARFLGERTCKLVMGSVQSVPPKNNQFTYTFCLVAPILNQYQFPLFTIGHEIDFYPLKVYPRFEELFQIFNSDDDLGTYIEVHSEEEFINLLIDLFSSSETRRVIHTLMAQSQPL
jgi:hypothetical protein